MQSLQCGNCICVDCDFFYYRMYNVSKVLGILFIFTCFATMLTFVNVILRFNFRAVLLPMPDAMVVHSATLVMGPPGLLSASVWKKVLSFPHGFSYNFQKNENGRFRLGHEIIKMLKTPQLRLLKTPQLRLKTDRCTWTYFECFASKMLYVLIYHNHYTKNYIADVLFKSIIKPFPF